MQPVKTWASMVFFEPSTKAPWAIPAVFPTARPTNGHPPRWPASSAKAKESQSGRQNRKVGPTLVKLGENEPWCIMNSYVYWGHFSTNHWITDAVSFVRITFFAIPESSRTTTKRGFLGYPSLRSSSLSLSMVRKLSKKRCETGAFSGLEPASWKQKTSKPGILGPFLSNKWSWSWKPSEPGPSQLRPFCFPLWPRWWECSRYVIRCSSFKHDTLNPTKSNDIYQGEVTN